MERVLFNKDLVAVPSRIANDAVSIGIDPFINCATEYGLFLPITGSGYAFLRWIQKGFPELEKEAEIESDLLHISNTGEVFVVLVATLDNKIMMLPYKADDITYLSASRDYNEAYTYLFAKRKLNMAAAIKLLEDASLKGFYNPQIFSVNDWVEHAKEKGYTKTFLRTQFKK